MLIAHLQMLLLSNELHRCCCYFCSPDVLISVIKLKLRTTVWMISIVDNNLIGQYNLLCDMIMQEEPHFNIFMDQHFTETAARYFLIAFEIVTYVTLLTVQVVAAQNLVVARSY